MPTNNSTSSSKPEHSKQPQAGTGTAAQPAEKTSSSARRRAASRKTASAEDLAPVARCIAHDLFIVAPNTDRIARQFGLTRSDAQDTVLYELHRRLARMERREGFSGEAVPFRSVRETMLDARRQRRAAAASAAV